MTGQRLNPDLIRDILDALDRHGYTRADNEHAGRAILVISDLARIYEGAQDHPFGPYVSDASPSRTEPGIHDAVTVPPGEVKTVLAALDIAADDKRDRAAACADCTGQSCPTCESRLQHARSYDRLAAHLSQAAEASATTPDPVTQPQPAADREAGQ